MLAGVAIAVIGGFFAVVAPLFSTSSAPSADLAGAIPSQASSRSPLEIDLGLDNTSFSLISPICINATISGPLRPDHAVFQGVDTVQFHNGRVCGGALSGQETISVKVYLTPTSTGTANVSLTPSQGAAKLGNPLRGAIAVTPA